MKTNTEIHNIINDVFYALKDKKYMVIKYSGFDHLRPGNDIDILCNKKSDVSKVINSVLNGLISEREKIRICENDCIHIDIIRDEEIYFRFDLIDNFNSFKKITIRESYTEESLNRRVSSEHTFNGIKYPIFYSREDDDLVIRFLDFVENYNDRPDKIKHYDYIMDIISKDPAKARFLKTLGEIVEMPSIVLRHGYLFPPKYSIRKHFSFQISKVKSLAKKLSKRG